MNEPNPNNSYSNGIKETPTFKMNKYINIQNRLDNINENEGDDKNNLLDYMSENGVNIDPDPVIRTRTKFAPVTAVANGLSRYRRK